MTMTQAGVVWHHVIQLFVFLTYKLPNTSKSLLHGSLDIEENSVFLSIMWNLTYIAQVRHQSFTPRAEIFWTRV